MFSHYGGVKGFLDQWEWRTPNLKSKPSNVTPPKGRYKQISHYWMGRYRQDVLDWENRDIPVVEKAYDPYWDFKCGDNMILGYIIGLSILAGCIYLAVDGVLNYVPIA